MSTNRPYRLGVLLGDGIGPEIVPASVRVADAALAAALGGRRLVTIGAGCPEDGA